MKTQNNLLNKPISTEIYFSIIFFSLMVIACIMPELAFAIPAGPESLAKAAEQVKKEVQGSGMMIALNALGVSCVGYSLFNGLSKAPLVAGGVILAFANLYFPYVNSNYAITN